MSGRSGGDANSDVVLRVPRLELLLVLAALVVSAAFALGGLALTAPDQLLSFVILLLVALLFNLLLYWLDGRGLVEGIVAWGARLGNLVFLTGGVYLTGTFGSPLFILYAIYLVVGGLRYGWPGTLKGFVFCSLSWVVLILLSPPAELSDWAWVAVSIGALLSIALVVGALAHRHVTFREESLRHSRELAFLREAGRSLGASLDPQDVLAVTLARANELLDVEAASLALVDPETERITFELAIGGGNETVRGLRLEPGQGIVGQVIKEGRSILVPDVRADPRWYNGVDQVSGYRTRSILCVPLRAKGQVIGALEVLNKCEGPFTDEDQRLLSSLADLAAQAIENARLHNQIRQHIGRLQEAYSELRRLDELRSSFIRSVFYELRTPLTLIEGYLEMVLDEQFGSLQSELLQSLTIVKNKSAQLNTMVNDIISLQTIGVLGYELEILDLESLARDALDAMRTRAEKANIRLEMRLADDCDLPPVKGDARRLRQVFDHLLDNAVKFSPSGGTVLLSLEAELGMVRARVKDQGIGISKEQCEHIFDRFYQVDRSSTRHYGGTGLGLALVKEVMEAHGGGVLVESEPGQGSTFTVFLPTRNR